MLSDHEIAEGLKQGSSEAFRALYQAHGSAVLSYLARLTGRKEMAEELTQETFLMVIRKIGFFRAGPDGNLKAWMFRIATHLAIDVLRREKKFVEMPANRPEERDPGAGPEEEMSRTQFDKILSDALMGLTEGQRTTFLLKEQEELSVREISRVTGGSENSIKQSLFRARAALKRKLLCEI